MINSANKKKANPKRIDNSEGLKSMRGASTCPIAAPAIIRIMGNTYIKKVAFNNEAVSKLKTIRSPTLAPAEFMALTSIAWPSPVV
jgi:hypothetical protein